MDGLVHWWIMNKWLAGWLVGWMDRCGWGDGWVGRWMDSTSNSEVPALCQAQSQALKVLRWLAPALNFKGTHSPTGQDVILLNQYLIRAITKGRGNGLSIESGCTDWVPKDTQVSLGHCIQHRISHTSQAFLWPKWNLQRVNSISFPLLLLLLLLLSRFSRVRLCATPWTAAHQAPPSLGFSRQEHWSGLPFPSPMRKSEKWKWSRSVVSDPQRPHGLQPSKLFCPWDLPGKSTGVGCHCLLCPSTEPPAINQYSSLFSWQAFLWAKHFPPRKNS